MYNLFQYEWAFDDYCKISHIKVVARNLDEARFEVIRILYSIQQEKYEETEGEYFLQNNNIDYKHRYLGRHIVDYNPDTIVGNISLDRYIMRTMPIITQFNKFFFESILS